MNNKKIAFLSNYFNHHQKYLSDAFDKITYENYYFFETDKLSQERSNLGWEKLEKKKYIKNAYSDDSKQIIYNADSAIFGSAPYELVIDRLRNNKLTFLYSERLYKSGYEAWKFCVRFVRFWSKYGRYKNLYLLCASAYTYADFAKTFTFIGKAYKWGYFPKTYEYNIIDLQQKKQRNQILWCGRFIDLKHPCDAIHIAQWLKRDGYIFEMKFIGTGILEERLEQMIIDYQLNDCVKILGAMNPKNVRKHMESAGIFLFTSDRNEGWGAVLNESMNSGCAVVASHAIGSVPYLINNYKNGLIYESGNIQMLYEKVKYLLDNTEEQEKLGVAAYKTISNEWNAEVAASRFSKLSEHILNGEVSPDLYESGPCSKAEVLIDNWFKDEKIFEK